MNTRDRHREAEGVVMRTELYGRDAALSVVSHALGSVGRAGACLLATGERGIGKSAFVLACQVIAREQNCRVLETAGAADESHLAFASLQRLLRPVSSLVEVLPSAQRGALLTAIGMHEGPAPDLLVVSLAVLGVIKQVSMGQPLVIAVDDIHLMDDASLEVLSFVARRLAPRQIIVATAPSLQDVLPLAETVTEIVLRRLDDQDSEKMITSQDRTLDGNRIQWVKKHAVGNPLALVELTGVVRTLAVPDVGPFAPAVPLSPALERAFGDKLGELPPASLDAILVASLDAASTVQEVLAATAVLRGERVGVDVLDLPRSQGLLTYDETRIAFAHPLMRSAVANSESVGRRQLAHRALGETVIVSLGRRTWHRASGVHGRDNTIAAELETLGAECVRRNDPTGAVMAWERAAQLSATMPDRSRRFLLAATGAATGGDLRRANQLLSRAETDDLSEFDQMRAGLLRDLWEPHTNDSERVLRLCRQARRAVAVGEDALALDLGLAAANTRFSAHVNLSALTELDRMAHALLEERENPKILAILGVLDPIGYEGEITEGLSTFDRHEVADSDVLVQLAMAARGAGDYTLGLEFLDEAESRLRAGGRSGQLAPLLTLAIDMRLETGEWEVAAATIAEVTKLAAQAFSRVPAEILVAAAKIAALRGRSADAIDLALQAQHTTSVRRGSPILAGAQIARGIAYIAAGRHFDAYSELARVFDSRSPSHHFREQLGAVVYLAEASVRCGQQTEVRLIVDRLAPMVNDSASPLITSQLRYARAVIAADDDAEQLFLDCLSSDAGEWPWPRARAQLAYGRWLRRQRRVSQARVPLASAHATFVEIGAVRWAEEALDELEAAGRPSGQLYIDSVAASLSVQEMKIARLAAAGMSNTEIGQQLYLSPRTVGSHLYRIFPKLGISARAQLASRLSELVD